MELLDFSLRYARTVLWGWGGLALSLLGLVELIVFLYGKPLKALREWLGKYRWGIAIMLIMLSQAVAYYKLERHSDLQTLNQRVPPQQSFGGSLQAFNTQIGKDDWAVPWGTNNVVVDWDMLDDAYEAVAEVTVRTYTSSYDMQPDLKTSVRLKLVPDGTIIETRDIANKDGIGRFILPRLTGRKEYQIEIKLFPNTQASVVGQVVFDRH